MKSMFYLTKEELIERGLPPEGAEKVANFISDAKKGVLSVVDEFELEYLEDIFETEELPEGSVPFDTDLVRELKVLYYDIEQNAIRSFNSSNLISWEFGDLKEVEDE